MTRALTISLLLFFLADAVGIILYLFVDWYAVKKEMTHLLASGELDEKAITLTLDKEEFQKIRWIEADHEFYYDGKLYDMTSLTTLADNLSRIRCVEDQGEEEFYEHIGQIVDQNESNPNHQRILILSIFKFLSGLIFQLIPLPVHDQSLWSHSGDAYFNLYHFSFNSILVQPPNIVSFSI